MAIWQLGNAVPRIHPTAYVHPSAQVIGDVTLRAHTNVWPGAVLRADFGQIDVGERSSRALRQRDGVALELPVSAA
jgi:carbonic anhydrase/acetyltransferase-like protein (isoleucine patch superfamily)